MRVIGTAGHVDHGKSTLIRRLTGIDPDRLAEEKAREMTIDLGFAWLALPDGDTIGFIDVPGHRDFIENMLAGIGGIDAVLLVIAADEGVMPQTREHLAILNLLGIERGLIVLTKLDMVSDAEWLSLVQTEIRDTLQGSALQDAPLIPVSAHTGQGIDNLLAHLYQLIAALPARPDRHSPRLPIDRVFTMSGFGTVVTGTLTGGSLRTGDEVEIQPGSLRTRVRALQQYKEPTDIVHPGSRVAVNLSGVAKDQLARGQVLSYPGHQQVSDMIDVHYHHLADASHPLLHNAEVKVFVGSAETTAHVRLLDSDSILPGMTGWLQLRLASPLSTLRGDRFILRRSSPAETIGGGVIVDAAPVQRWKRFRPEVIEQLSTRLSGTPSERIAQLASGSEPVKRAALAQASSLSADEFSRALDEALTQRLVVEFPGDTFWSSEQVSAALSLLTRELNAYHRSNPLRLGMPREEARSRLGVKQATFSTLLALSNDFAADGQSVRLSSHHIRFDHAQQQRIDRLFAIMSTVPNTPPSYSEAAQIVGNDVLAALVELGDLVRVQPEIIIERTVFDAMVSETLALIDQHGAVTAAMLRDAFGTTRKYAIGLLEFLDTQGITKRVGDARVRR